MGTETQKAEWWVWCITLTSLIGAAFGVARFAETTDTPLTWVALASAAVIAGGFLSLPTRGFLQRSLAYGVVAALPMMASGGERVFDDPGAAAATISGLAILCLFQILRGADQRILIVEVLRAAAAFFVYLYVLDRMGDIEVLGDWAPSARFLTAALAAFLVEALVAGLLVLIKVTGQLSHWARRSLSDFDAFLATTGVGALFGITFDWIGWWAAGLALLVYGFTYAAFQGFQEARITYDQTLVALSQIGEVAGHSARGHAARTSELARELALAWGVSPSEALLIERVGLLHDVGRVTLNEPGVIRQGFTDADIARWGAEIIRQSEPLQQVAQAVERLWDSYRTPGGVPDPTLPLASRIVNVVCQYVKYVIEGGMPPLEAVDILHRQSLEDVDPEIVDLLRKVLERKGTLAEVLVRT